MSSPSTKRQDRTTDYAKAVLKGTYTVSAHVKNACRRHLDDLKHAGKRGFVFNKDAANRVFSYFENVLKLNGGQFEGKPFLLLPWQAFVLGCLFGWQHKGDGLRRFRTAYIETAKGSGKSPLAAGVGLYGLTADNESRAEVYAAAAKKDQASILFRDAVAMVDQSPLLAPIFQKSGSRGKEWNLAHHRSGSFFRTLSSDKAQSGTRPHIALLDEIHEHPDGSTVELIRSGTKSRSQALIFMITNSGHDKNSTCWHYHEYGAKVASGAVQDDEFFAFICGVDEGDDPLNDESCWPKANPSLEHGIPGYKYLRGQVTGAKGMPSREAEIKRLNFCVWTESLSPWISHDVWRSCQDEAPYSLDDFAGRKCWAGLDLSSTQDLTSLVLLFAPTKDDPVQRLMPFFWLPGEHLHRKAEQDKVPYVLWRDRGFLHTTQGSAIDKLGVLQTLLRLGEVVDIQAVAYDRWRIEDLKMLADREGYHLPPLVAFGQGFKDMSPALEQFETALLNQTVRHDGHPVLTWNAANAVAVQDPAGNRKVDKAKATGRVDGIVATVMAFGCASAGQAPMRSVYEDRGIRTL